MGPCIHRLKRSALMKKGTKSATNSCYGNNKHVVFLKLQPELKKKKKKKKYIYHKFPQTLDAGLYIWLLPATFHCKIFKKTLFLTSSTSWQKMFSSFPHIDWQFPQ